MVPVLARPVARYHERPLLVEALANAVSFQVRLVERVHARLRRPRRLLRPALRAVPVLRRRLVGRARVRKPRPSTRPPGSFEFISFYRLCAAAFGFAPFALPALFFGAPAPRALLSERFEVDTFLSESHQHALTRRELHIHPGFAANDVHSGRRPCCAPLSSSSRG